MANEIMSTTSSKRMGNLKTGRPILGSVGLRTVMEKQNNPL